MLAEPTNDDLILELAQFSGDPLGHVMYSYPWGEPGGELEEFTGPEQWQVDILMDLKHGLVDLSTAIMLATTSGHGIGKSALVAWLIWWGMSTFEDTIGVVTANTENQLKTKTWVQVAKWHRMFIGKALFKLSKTAVFSTDPEHSDTWRFDMVPWSERNTEAFAGLHNKGKRILIIFDEASAIDDVIWEVTEGALTDSHTEIIWAVFGNPTKNSGRFRECFAGGRFERRWKSRAIDSRTVTLTNKKKIAEWIEDYGEDHDFVRVRVRGMFPRIDATSFISLEIAREAADRPVSSQTGAGIIIGVDVGRFGDDPSVIYPRRGRDASSFQIEVHHGLNTMQLAGRVAALFNLLGATIVMVDGGGVGGGVVDRLRQLRIPVIEVGFGDKADNINEIETGIKYGNKRAEIWGAVRDWLPEGSIPSSIPGAEESLVDELIGPGFHLNVGEAIILESKKEMRRRGVASPNVADALACTFAFPSYAAIDAYALNSVTVAPDYDPYSKESMSA